MHRNKCLLVFSVFTTIASVIIYLHLNREKIITNPKTKNRKNTATQTPCDSLYHTGKWKNFKTNGFSRTVSQNYISEQISNVYHPKYPLKRGGFKTNFLIFSWISSMFRQKFVNFSVETWRFDQKVRVFFLFVPKMVHERLKNQTFNIS